ncbi:endonuclease [Oxalobacter sp. OttesenSCG-928-P03]|nr:endonuclease [Oxalobacter sp. OttesenSCG-928-P03]
MQKSQKSLILFILFLLFAPIHAFADGNQSVQSFDKAKKLLMSSVYNDYHTTFYCQGTFTPSGEISQTPEGFTAEKHQSRAKRVEWEHVVPAENFGRAFAAWRDGDPLCVSSKGKTFKGRNCAEKVSTEYRFMQADMHNLVPAIGAVNAARQNYNFTMLPEANASFGSCEMKIAGTKVEPPDHSWGAIARTYKYMDWAYPQYNMSKQQRRLMDAWDSMYPVTEWECVREQRIASLQGNSNPFVARQCAR